MTYLLIIVNLISLGYLLIRSINDFGKLNYFLIFATFNFLYGFAIPFEIVIFNKPSVIQGHLLTVNQMELILFLSTISNIGFYLGLLLTCKVKRTNYNNSNNYKQPLSIFLIFIFTLVFLLTYNREALLQSFKSYSGNAVSTYSNSIYAYTKEILFVTLTIIILFFLQKKDKRSLVSVLLTVILILAGFFTKDKNPILMASIPWFWLGLTYLYKKFSYRKWLILAFFLLGIAIIPIFNSLFGISRMKDDADIMYAFDKYGFFGLFESKDVMTSLIDITELNSHILGKTYGSAFVNWIPKGVWPQRPETLAESYAKYRLKDNWEPGKGMGFSLLAEAYLNFGVYGAFIQYFFMGLLFGFLRKLTANIFIGYETYADLLFFIWAFNELVLMHRGQFNMPSSYIRFFLPLFVFYLIFDKHKILSYLIKWKN